MENKSKLPKYWVVKNDGSQRFKDEVIAYMKRIAPASNLVGDSVGYYGVDGTIYGVDGTIKEFSTGTSNGTDSHGLLRDFINNPVVLTINEFIDLKNGEELKIIRYKLKKPELRRAVAELLNGIIRFNGSGYDEMAIYPEYASEAIKKLRDEGVLDLWFTVDYEESKVLVLGSKGVTVEISNGNIEADGTKFNINFLEETFYNLSTPPKCRWNLKNKSYEVSYTERKVIIGCSEFSQEDIRKIITTYREMTPHERGKSLKG